MKKVYLSEPKVDACFEEKTEQAEVWVALYKLVYPGWDKIEQIDGYPACSPHLNDYIFRKFMAFDAKHHPDVLPGGLWINRGWSSIMDEDEEDILGGGYVLPAPAEYKVEE